MIRSTLQLQGLHQLTLHWRIIYTSTSRTASSRWTSVNTLRAKWWICSSAGRRYRYFRFNQFLSKLSYACMHACRYSINGDHWVTSSSIGGEVTLYDSRFKGNVSASLSQQQCTAVWLLTLKCMCQPFSSRQETTAGVFAVAFALHALLPGDKIETLEFDQSKMRQ